MIHGSSMVGKSREKGRGKAYLISHDVEKLSNLGLRMINETIS
jgi:hypothetical protein